MSSRTSTPQTNPKKKRALSSPADQRDLKKSKVVSEKDSSTDVIHEEIETRTGDITPTQITLSDDNLAQISGHLKSSF